MEGKERGLSSEHGKKEGEKRGREWEGVKRGRKGRNARWKRQEEGRRKEEREEGTESGMERVNRRTGGDQREVNNGKGKAMMEGEGRMAREGLLQGTIVELPALRKRVEGSQEVRRKERRKVNIEHRFL